MTKKKTDKTLIHFLTILRFLGISGFGGSDPHSLVFYLKRDLQRAIQGYSEDILKALQKEEYEEVGTITQKVERLAYVMKMIREVESVSISLPHDYFEKQELSSQKTKAVGMPR